MQTRLRTLDDVAYIRFRGMAAPDRMIVPFEGSREVPFDIQRVFTINADRAGLIGGCHAHRRCSQLIVCLHGAADIACMTEDAGTVRVLRADRPDRGVLVPPSIWAEQRYLTDDAVLMVLCDEHYDATDYIRDWDVYCAFRGAGRAVA